ncbi:MAG TPA: DUF2089 family protein [Vicinamibacterales bacterium]
MVTKDWHTLTKLTGGGHIEIERVRLVEQDVAIEGPFELPPLAQLSADDQVFVAAFVRCHGSIKQMEKFFGVSYPTIKNRLNRIGALLPFMEVEPVPDAQPRRASASDLLSKLERGEMSARDVVAELKSPPPKETDHE